ncbi:hypothetical protein BU26DRAFT_499224 [Trematosphaeria pertusa]|uniref:Uncharacterized protein n=1 Tax=Trematosphaeria pertusa TaxID=390896 RepID=A0A6A6J1C1_9PLEO|nr:uncharacterized protein BU26DRAFT_499224 [Trematosphaeria pertusa]KAF2256574.1 hypothetical protein BU26DRAFT_499224 [Trematosphaeria pertusa]
MGVSGSPSAERGARPAHRRGVRAADWPRPPCCTVGPRALRQVPIFASTAQRAYTSRPASAPATHRTAAQHPQAPLPTMSSQRPAPPPSLQQLFVANESVPALSASCSRVGGNLDHQRPSGLLRHCPL